MKTNFGQYGLGDKWMDGLVADLTNSPLRTGSRTESGGRQGWLDGIVCDPPYGVREGLKVLGRSPAAIAIATKNNNGAPPRREEYLKEGYVPPKRAYSLEKMLGDILAFSVSVLVVGGRVSLWMPAANEAEEVLALPKREGVVLESVCTQVFNKWSRRLLTYRRVGRGEVDGEVGEVRGEGEGERVGMGMGEMEGTADELNGFRRRYFRGFRNVELDASVGGKAVGVAERGKERTTHQPDVPPAKPDGESSEHEEVVKQSPTLADDTDPQPKIL